jgi:uncharacterized protein (DUF1330 family)
MPAYLIYICQEVLDIEEMRIYWSKIGDTLKGYSGVNVMTAYTPVEQLEGDPIHAAIVTEFSSADIARDWYNSPGYTAVRQHRIRGGKYIGVLVEGGVAPLENRLELFNDTK